MDLFSPPRGAAVAPVSDAAQLTPFVLPLAEIDRYRIAVAGGRGADLGEMVKASLPVPDGFVVTMAAHRVLDETRCALGRAAERRVLPRAARTRLEEWAEE